MRSAMNVSEQLLQILADAGVKQIFGLTGDALNYFVDAIRRQDKVEWVTVRHEESAAYAAYAQAALSGHLAVCAGTVGPGALHLINGLYNAKREHVPVLAITGQVPISQMGTNYHQEVDLGHVFDDVCAYQALVRSPQDAPRLIQRAMRIAVARRAVCRVELPADVAQMDAEGGQYITHLPISHAVLHPGKRALRAAADALASGKRVAILAGEGCRGAREAVLDLAETLQAPIVHTLRAADIFDHDTPGVVGLTGLIGDPAGYNAIMKADRLLMIGTDFPYIDFLPHETRTVQIDRYLETIGNRTPVEVAVHGDIKESVTQLNALLPKDRDGSFRRALMDAFSSWKDRMRVDASTERDREPLHPQMFARCVGQKAATDAVFSIETGSSVIWAARYMSFHGDRRILGSFNHGSMGVGLPSAIGAQMLHPHREVWALLGDGSFTMCLQEFLTAVERSLPLKLVVFNNAELAFVKLEMEQMGLAPGYEALKQFNPDFAAFAKVCGGEGVRVEHARDVEAAVDMAKASEKPFIIDAVVSAGEVALPPHITWKQVFGFGRSKVEEAALAATGNTKQRENFSEEIEANIRKFL